MMSWYSGGAGPRGSALTPAEMNDLRRTGDAKQRESIIDILNRAKLIFSVNDLLVLAQPDLRDSNLQGGTKVMPPLDFGT
jgi:hypothetical protein